MPENINLDTSGNPLSNIDEWKKVKINNKIFNEKKIIQKFNRPILIIGSKILLEKQMKLLKYSIKIKEINFILFFKSISNN